MTLAGHCLHPFELLDFLDVKWPTEGELTPPELIGQELCWQLGLSYPSPPMSGASSPSKQSQQQFPDFASQDTQVISPSRRHTPSGQTVALTSPSAPCQTSLARPSSSAQLSRPESPPRNIENVAGSSTQQTDASNPPGPSTTLTASNLGRGERRSKAHVANACSNCKRAHLSCDVQRPCTRCVATGKAVRLPHVLAETF